MTAKTPATTVGAAKKAVANTSSSGGKKNKKATSVVDSKKVTATTGGNAATTTKWGEGLTQKDLMEKDTVLVVDDADRIIGSAQKAESHVFDTKHPHGILHRAFSVFLFDTTTNRLLLQQRAKSKITFPSVWTNTCCSHPLFGMIPDEIDSPDDIAKGTVPGVKYGAIRKLGHELGIPPEQIDVEQQMKFLTRLHYWAADTITHGPQTTWGEHEVDHVLIWCVPNAEKILTIQPHPDEVDSVRWVSQQELQDMLNDPQLLFSPWFRLIAQRWLLPDSGAANNSSWWSNLGETMNTDKFIDYETIHCFDPPREHWGGSGNAQPLFLPQMAMMSKGSGGGVVEVDASKKQGAYGKIPIHKESKVSQLLRFDEVFSALTLLYLSPLQSNLENPALQQRFAAGGLPDDVAFCHDILVQVSRSFAAVILSLPAVLLVDILIFYLVLRALDTIEDDTSAFSSHEEKIDHLLNFHKNALMKPDWTVDGVGQGDERRLLQQFPRVYRVYVALPEASQRIITDITQRMATGMAEFVSKDLGQGTSDIDQYNRYCHFVAGLVGEGLSRLFAASGLESKSFESELYLSDQMGLFLQKTNIIRDYLEDYVDKRAFWPQTVWKKYAVTQELGYFTNQADPGTKEKSLHCLNELVTDALELVPDCLMYMSKVQCQEIFRFCAIPQVMAIATLEKCYANPDVFTGVVKIRKGLSCKLIVRTNTLSEVHETFYDFAKMIGSKALKAHKAGAVDPSYSRTLRVCSAICELTRDAAIRQKKRRFLKNSVGSLIVVLPYAACLFLSSERAPTITSILSSCWTKPKQGLVQSGLALAAGLLYMYGPWSSSPLGNLKRAEQLERDNKVAV